MFVFLDRTFQNLHLKTAGFAPTGEESPDFPWEGPLRLNVDFVRDAPNPTKLKMWSYMNSKSVYCHLNSILQELEKVQAKECPCSLLKRNKKHIRIFCWQGSAVWSGAWGTWGWPESDRPLTPGLQLTSCPSRCRVQARPSYSSQKLRNPQQLKGI